MKDKVILITGGTSGIGRAAALAIAGQGATVVFTYRDRSKGEETLREIRKKTGSRSVHMLEVELSSLESVRRLAENFKKDFKRLDVLINNAGGYYGYRKTTAEGYEYTFGVNHLSHFLLTNLLKELLVSDHARIINVSSQAQRVGHIHFHDLMLENRFTGFKAYAQAKLANILFTYELARRWGENGIAVNAVHPGAVRTNFGNEAKPLIRFMIKLGKPFLKSPRKGADTVVYLASSPGVKGITGKYFAARKQINSSKESHDREIGARLWEVSKELTGMK
jgi:NAD(P)-dependent dehydrogenase (short-subunit alcohol dehydrogenase family)